MVQKEKDREFSFPQKVWMASGITAFIVVLLLTLKATFSVLLLVLAGALIAVFFRGLSDLVQRHTQWKTGLCVTLAILSTLTVIALLLWLIGAKVVAQADELSKTLPATVEKVNDQLNQSAIGQKVVQILSSPKMQKEGQTFIQLFFKSTFGVLGDVYVVLFIGIFFTVSPKIYKDGIIKLVPPKGKAKAKDILTKTGENLRKWLMGKLFAMLVVFILTSIGLVIMGVPLWLVLALIAGILNFIPNFGPLIALMPAVLIGLLQGPSTAIWIVILYVLIQVAESNFITPIVQQRLIRIPPAMIIIGQMLIAPLAGGWGLILATPMMVILIIMARELYLNTQRNE